MPEAPGGSCRPCPRRARSSIRAAPRHSIDPAKLIAGSIAVYGEDVYRELYGELVPIPADRVVTTTRTASD